MTLLEDFSEFYQLSGGECLNMAIFSKWRVFDGVALVENSVYRGGGRIVSIGIIITWSGFPLVRNVPRAALQSIRSEWHCFRSRPLFVIHGRVVALHEGDPKLDLGELIFRQGDDPLHQWTLAPVLLSH